MGTFLVYIIKSAFCMTLLYLPYTLLLRRERLHRLNRLALLAILVVSFLLPAVREEWFGGAWMSWQSAVPDGAYASFLGQIGGTGMRLPEMVVTPASSAPWWPVWLVGAYFLGVVVSLVVRLWQLARLLWFIPHGCLWKEHREDGITLYCHARPVLPFSWMRGIVVSEADWEGAEARAVYLHEEAHVIYGHSWDTMLMLAAETLQWFNPVVWMMETDMRCIHEYQADDYVLRQGINAKNYQLYLIKKAVGSRLQSFANGLNQSTLKKRIAMMCNKKSNKWAALKYMYLLPVGAFATVAFAHPEFTNRVDSRLGAVSAVKVTDLSATRHAVAAENVQPEPLKNEKGGDGLALGRIVFGEARLETAQGNVGGSYLRLEDARVQTEEVYDKADVNPEFPGGSVKLFKFIADHIRYPKECIEKGISGRVYVQFVVGKDGSLRDIKVIRSPDSRLSEEAVRVVGLMPKWKPGQKGGKTVAVRFSLPVMFHLK